VIEILFQWGGEAPIVSIRGAETEGQRSGLTQALLEAHNTLGEGGFEGLFTQAMRLCAVANNYLGWDKVRSWKLTIERGSHTWVFASLEGGLSSGEAPSRYEREEVV
jgi:hypothetical protein